MALRALLYSKNPETADSLAAMLGETGIRAEVCADIFSAIDKATKQSFPCIIADWLDQPEAGFLLKRARESASNRSAIAIAIVDRELAPEEVRERQLDFLIYRPISADEARAVLAKARRRMQLQTASAPNLRAALLQPDEGAPPEESGDPNLVSLAADLPEPPAGTYPSASPESEAAADTLAGEPAADGETAIAGAEPGWRSRLRAACAVALLIFAALCLWRSRVVFRYLARAPEGTTHVLRESVAAFYANQSGAQPAGSAMTDAQQDAYLSRTSGGKPYVQTSNVQVVNADITLPDTPAPLPKAFDLPLPTPVYEHAAAAPPRTFYAKVPESLKSSAPISAPVVVAVGPAQMGPAQVLPVSTAPPSLSQVSEPVALSEEAARALAVHTVAPVYPPEALAQKLQGAVVLQAVIARDGSVEDLKILRGYFLLGRAAVAAVKQWRFRPYILNGRPLETKTVITVNFTYPPG
ncbi:MAG: TonB family protein [Terriglobales bacterium]